MNLSRRIGMPCLAAGWVLGTASMCFSQEAGREERITIQMIDGADVMTVTSGDTQRQMIIPANPGVKTSGGAVSVGPMSGGVVTFGADGKPQVMNINEVRQRAFDQLKEQLGSADAEWAILQPKIERIQSLASDAGVAVPRIGVSTTSKSTSTVLAKQQALRQAIQNGAASDSEMKQKIADLREARAQARELLAKARQELAELVTSRQEAILIDRGILD